MTTAEVRTVNIVHLSFSEASDTAFQLILKELMKPGLGKWTARGKDTLSFSFCIFHILCCLSV